MNSRSTLNTALRVAAWVLTVLNVCATAFYIVDSRKTNGRLRRMQRRLNTIKDDLNDITEELNELTDELNDEFGREATTDVDTTVDEDIDNVADIDTVVVEDLDEKGEEE